MSTGPSAELLKFCKNDTLFSSHFEFCEIGATKSGPMMVGQQDVEKNLWCGTGGGTSKMSLVTWWNSMRQFQDVGHRSIV